MAKRPAGSTKAASPPAPAGPRAPKVSKAPETSQLPETSQVPAAPANPTLRLAAAAQAIEAVGLGVATVYAAVGTADGRSYRLDNGIALTLLAFVTALGVAAISVALARAKPWTRTPVVMTQVLVAVGGVILLQGQRPEWGVPALLLAAVCVAGLLTPASLRALNRPTTPAAPTNPPTPSRPPSPSRPSSRRS
jgi:hypothetical protein